MIRHTNILFINDIDIAEKLAHGYPCGERYKIIFGSSILKDRFLTIMEIMHDDYLIVNCNTSLKLFSRQIESTDKYHKLIFNNVNKCHDEDILEFINNSDCNIIC